MSLVSTQASTLATSNQIPYLNIGLKLLHQDTTLLRPKLQFAIPLLPVEIFHNRIWIFLNLFFRSHSTQR